jgi:ubiquinone/menaquinone biosynthesis C-methylase UbiE
VKQEEIDWAKHWGQDKQRSFSQRFFSWYRKAVFARTVHYFTGRYFPTEGVFVEAGCGTAETSMRVDKHGGRRQLVALDLILPVLEHAHPVMDVRTAGDIFRLPFLDSSIDGIWNVGVMEHFTHPQIDDILREFRRVLKPGAPVILLWPATYSPPQRILRAIEWWINRKSAGEKFRFHPDEISQLRSVRQGREVLSRDEFEPVSIDFGLHSLMAFQTLVGRKTQRGRTCTAQERHEDQYHHPGEGRRADARPSPDGPVPHSASLRPLRR